MLDSLREMVRKDGVYVSLKELSNEHLDLGGTLIQPGMPCGKPKCAHDI